MKKSLFIILLCLMVTLTSCIKSKSSITTSNANYLTCSIGEFPESLGFIGYTNSCYNFMMDNLFEGLVAMDESGSIGAGLSDKWTVSSDGIAYVFDIRKDAKWSDGTLIKPKDIVNFFKEILSSKSENPYAYELYCIYGAENYSKGNGSFQDVAISALDDNKVQIRLNEPCGDFIKILSQPVFSVRQDLNNLKLWQDNYKNIKYSGAFQIGEINKDGAILQKNPYYWNSANVTKEKFMIMSNSNKEAALADFEDDKINILLNPPVSEMQRFISNDNTTIINSADVTGLYFNFSGNNPVEDINIRKQIYGAIDAEELAKEYLSEYDLSGVNIFKSDAFTGNVNDALTTKSQDDKDTISLKILGVNSDINKRIARGIKKQIKDKLKINSDINLVQSDQIDEEVKENDFDILLDTIRGDYEGENAVYKRFITDNPFNYGKYKNSNIDKLIKKEIYSNDSTVKKNSIKDSADILKTDCVFIPLFHNVDVVLKSNYIDGIKISHYGNLKLDEINQK